MRFQPPRCPYTDCSTARIGAPFRWRHRGHYVRRCDARRVQRFECLACRRRFSTQSFRLDFRLHRPWISYRLWPLFVSKVTHRQSARMLGTSRKTVAHRLRLLGDHCRGFQRQRLRRGEIRGSFQLDELETYEFDRRRGPVSMPVLVESESLFVVDCRVASLPSRERRPISNTGAGSPGVVRRRNTSNLAVARCLARLRACVASGTRVRLRSDSKPSYRKIVSQTLGPTCVHSIVSHRHRGRRRALFAVRHTLAMLRDGISRLVRRTWAASKRRTNLARHAWIWIVWRNFARGVTNRDVRTTPAMRLGLEDRRWSVARLLRWSMRFLALHRVH